MSLADWMSLGQELYQNFSVGYLRADLLGHATLQTLLLIDKRRYYKFGRFWKCIDLLAKEDSSSVLVKEEMFLFDASKFCFSCCEGRVCYVVVVCSILHGRNMKKPDNRWFCALWHLEHDWNVSAFLSKPFWQSSSVVHQAPCWVQDCLHLWSFVLILNSGIYIDFCGGLAAWCLMHVHHTSWCLADPCRILQILPDSRFFWFPRVPWPIMPVCIGELWISGMQEMQEHHLWIFVNINQFHWYSVRHLKISFGHGEALRSLGCDKWPMEDCIGDHVRYKCLAKYVFLWQLCILTKHVAIMYPDKTWKQQ